MGYWKEGQFHPRLRHKSRNKSPLKELQFQPMKFAIIYNWPGQKNSELELIKRIAQSSEKLGHTCIVIDPFGHPLNFDGVHNKESETFNSRDYDFCLNLHYFNPNVFDTFSYAVNWNPLDFIIKNHMDGSELSNDDVAFRTSCIESHDALLNAGSEEMNDFTASLNLVTKVHIVNNSLYLHTTSPEIEGMDFPDFSSFRIFYIGINWERQEGKYRHNGLTEQLDASNLVDFYGVGKQYNIPLWEGVKNYKKELPFDGGRSIIETSNKCGVSLVLHSQPHRNSGLASTRIFQACAAKTLTICDDNPFILQHFGNSVLSFKYSSDPAVNFSRIMEKVKWIQRHPDEALKMASRAHHIFVEKFALQKELANLFNKHDAHVKQHIEEFCALDVSSLVDVLYVYRGEEESVLESFFNDLGAQICVKPRAVVFNLSRNTVIIRNVARRCNIECDIVNWDETPRPCFPTNGKLVALYLRNYAEGKWFTFYSKRCRWKKLHLTQLVRAIASNPIALSSTFVKNKVFKHLLDDHYLPLKKCINTQPIGITQGDISIFAAAKFPAAALLFNVSSFQNHALYSALRFFDKGWAFFLVTWQHLHSRSLPVFIPKLTTIFNRDDDEWNVDIYIDSTQTESHERSLTRSFLKNDPSLLSLNYSPQNRDNFAKNNSSEFSINEYLNNVLRSRPLFLTIYQGCFRLACFILKLPHKKIEKDQANN